MTTPGIIPQDLINWDERQYLPQYGGYTASFTIYIGGAPADPDGEAVTASWASQNNDQSVTLLRSQAAARTGTGVYEATLGSGDTAVPADYELQWAYAISGAGQVAASLFEVGAFSPSYNALPLAFQAVVEFVWMRFKDLFDSPQGGPNLSTYFQAHWSRGRVADLLGVALRKLNGISQPYMTYSFDGSGGPVFPLVQWGGILESFCYIECLHHLIRSYAEQPDFRGGEVARLDRRDYQERWSSVLQQEMADVKDQLDVFKIRHMGFGNPKVLISGGVYGRYAPTRIAGSVAARPRMWARWRRGTNRTEAVVCPYGTLLRKPACGRSLLSPGAFGCEPGAAKLCEPRADVHEPGAGRFYVSPAGRVSWSPVPVSARHQRSRRTCTPSRSSRRLVSASWQGRP
jgi:hypothetical protein